MNLAVLEEEYEKMINTQTTAKPPAASLAQRGLSMLSVCPTGLSMLSVCPTGLATLDCRALLDSSMEEIVRSPVGFGKSWPIAHGTAVHPC